MIIKRTESNQILDKQLRWYNIFRVELERDRRTRNKKGTRYQHF